MPDAIITESAGKLLETGVIGAVCLLLIALLVVREKMWRKDLKDERDSHQATRVTHMEDVKKIVVLGENIREVLKSQVQQNQIFLDIVKDRGRD